MRPFGLIRIEGESGTGRWRPTPPWYAPTQLMVFAPYITPASPALFGPGPNALGSERYRRELAEVRAWGGSRSTNRDEAQGELARWWVGRDLDRSAMLTAATLMEARPGQLHEDARAMAQIAVAMADTYVIWAAAKQHFCFWRPVTAIQNGALPWTSAAAWLPLLPTPAHPEFPSGHAADITTAAVMISALFPATRQSVVFQGEGAGGGQARRYPNAEAAAAECRESRLWAGAHFRSANDDGKRLGEAVSQATLAALPVLPR